MRKLLNCFTTSIFIFYSNDHIKKLTVNYLSIIITYYSDIYYNLPFYLYIFYLKFNTLKLAIIC